MSDEQRVSKVQRVLSAWDACELTRSEISRELALPYPFVKQVVAAAWRDGRTSRDPDESRSRA